MVAPYKAPLSTAANTPFRKHRPNERSSRPVYCSSLSSSPLLTHKTACTATIVEIAYHNKDSIDAQVEFLGEEEWKKDLKTLVCDVNDKDDIRSISNLRSDAGIAWQKVSQLADCQYFRIFNFY